jgi:hypothetical protein
MRKLRTAAQRLPQALGKTTRTFVGLLPIIVGMLLLTSLAVTAFPRRLAQGVFGNGEGLDALIGAGLGSIAAGHPLASYLLGGELLHSGVGLVAVTALIVSWVTVGVVQLPAESLILGVRFAVYRNALCFCSAVAVAYGTVFTLRLGGWA